MDLFDWYYRQVVSPGELSAAFEAVDGALRTMVTTLGIHGLAVGGDVVPTTPTAGLSATVKGPVLAYDDDGNRIFLTPATSAVDLSVDENGAATQIFTPGQERYLGIFVRFTRVLSDPRTDGDGNEVMFARLEGAELVVAAGAPAPAGAASRAALRDGHVLLADVRLTTGQTQVTASHILTDRTQYLFRASSGALNLWGRTFPEIVQKIVDRFAQFMEDARQQFLLFGQQSQETYNTFVQTVNQALAAMIKHARDLPFTAASGISSTNVQAAIEEVKNTIPGPTQELAATAISFDQTALPGAGANVQLALQGMPAYLRSRANTFTQEQTFSGGVKASDYGYTTPKILTLRLSPLSGDSFVSYNESDPNNRGWGSIQDLDAMMSQRPGAQHKVPIPLPGDNCAIVSVTVDYLRQQTLGNGMQHAEAKFTLRTASLGSDATVVPGGEWYSSGDGRFNYKKEWSGPFYLGMGNATRAFVQIESSPYFNFIIGDILYGLEVKIATYTPS